MKYLVRDIEEMNKIEAVLIAHGIEGDAYCNEYDTVEFNSTSGRVVLTTKRGFDHKGFCFNKNWDFQKVYFTGNNENYDIHFIFSKLVVVVESYYYSITELTIEIVD